MLIKLYEKCGNFMSFEGYLKTSYTFLVDKTPIKRHNKEYYEIAFIDNNSFRLDGRNLYINKKDFKRLKRGR